ncbi:MAG: dihydrodipicolinate synthase family protein [Acidobacteriia bacterium]|nr:dihydrodipicolinate synthase family protein [Terriglobia bacterium]
MLLSGIFPPISTPFYPDGQVYYKKIESNVERYSRTPVAGIVVQGSTGEAILLSDQERRDVLKTAIAAAAPNKVMIAGTGIESAQETLRLTEYAAELGYDAAMVRTPHYYKKQMLAANLLAFYRTVADRSALPIIIYNFPQATGYDIPAEVVIELADHPNIVAIKESSGNLDKVKAMVDGTRQVKRQATVTETFEAVTPRMLKAAAADGEKQSRELVSVSSLTESVEKRAPSPVQADTSTKPSSSAVTVVGKLKTRQKEVGFQVMVGAAHQLEPSLGLGAVGAILAFACPAPMACYEIYAALKDGDPTLAREKQERVKLAAQRVAGELGVPGVKYAMDLNGYYGGPSRLPFLPLSGEQKAEIEKLMAGIKS